MFEVTFAGPRGTETRKYGDAATTISEAYQEARNIADMYGWLIVKIERKDG